LPQLLDYKIFLIQHVLDGMLCTSLLFGWQCISVQTRYGTPPPNYLATFAPHNLIVWYYPLVYNMVPVPVPAYGSYLGRGVEGGTSTVPVLTVRYGGTRYWHSPVYGPCCSTSQTGSLTRPGIYCCAFFYTMARRWPRRCSTH
jgi:hypothetical protein